ncbi:uncharacterized protein LODBEIA_P19250 [Lodderomyces beijingensis]|uniref:WH1 domain-containing protein n=1 Tax=Lodderomyces beijingensis TaxID=1775926 RepID=A0ABP0ZKQ8_9ASCO
MLHLDKLSSSNAVLTAEDKEKVKRAIPKPSNKIIDATVARLYIAYPDPTKWVFTGLMGAVAFVDDLVGHTFFLKLVDITGHRGVIWDQELYVNFEYNQDRKFFHTFEIEDCLVGLLFEDTNDATHFYKRVTNRQKHGSSATVKNKSAIALKEKSGPKGPNAPGPRGEYMDVNTAQRQRRAKGVLYYDDVPPPEWRSLYAELEAAGITEDMIADNRQFIKDYIAQQGGPLVGLEPPIPRKYQRANEKSESFESSTMTPSHSVKKNKKAPPPPPPSGQAGNTATSTPPQYNSQSPDTSSETASLAAETPEPSTFKPTFRLPPMNAKIPGRAQNQAGSNDKPLPSTPPTLPYSQPQASTSASTSSPVTAAPVNSQPTPPRTQFAVPPPFVPGPGQVNNNGVPPAPPSRSNGPPPPPRNANAAAPPPPPRGASLPPARNGGNPPAPPPPRSSRGPAPPPPPSRSTHANPAVPPQPPQPPQRAGVASPPPPPRPTSFATSPPPPPASYNAIPNNGPPPPPPAPPMMSSNNGPPAPPPPPSMGTGAPPAPPPPAMPIGGGFSEATGDAGRDALLASIRGAGIGSLKKSDKSQLDKPSVLLQEARGEKSATDLSSANPAGGPPGSLADALSAALGKRKAKVAHSDDEDDDEW